MTELNHPQRLFREYEQIAERFPNDTAFIFLDNELREERYSYARLMQESRELAERITAILPCPGVPLGILLPSQEQQAVHYLAALAAGAVPAILTPPNRKLRRDIFDATIRALTDCCHFSWIITDLEELEIKTGLLEPLTLHRCGEPDRSAQPVPDTAILQFTSGTTGIKRGVQISCDAMLSSMRSYARALNLGRGDVILSWLPLYHDMGFIACLNMPLACGVPSVMINPLDWVAAPELFPMAATRYGATISWNPNFAYSFMADRTDISKYSEIDLSSLRALINCSEPVTFESQNRFEKQFTPCGLGKNIFRGCYAMAEATFALTDGTQETPGYLDYQGYDGAENRQPNVSVGEPIQGVELAIMDENDMPLAERQLGEIWVKSPFLFSGYYRNDEATSAVTQNGWYRTGDTGYRAGNNFYICGRKKDLLILNGVNVFPQDVEEVVSRLPGVIPGRVVAFALFNETSQSEMMVVLAESEDPGKSETIITIRQTVLAMLQVSNFQVHLLQPRWLIKSSSGKLSRQANREKWLSEQKTFETASVKKAQQIT